MINNGDLLISTPESLGDYYFNRSIIILTEVSNEEVVGFIINKELNYSLSDLDNKVIEKGIKIFSGGPVNQDNLYFIHKHPDLIDNSINFFNDLHWGGNFKKIIEMINTDRPVIFDCLVDKIENCFPMIPSGKPHNQMLLGPKDQEENKITGKGKTLV